MSQLGDPLSDRELDVLECVVDGASNKEIAARLFISPNTVKVHLRRIYAKLGVSSRTEAAKVAHEQRLLASLEPEPVVEEPKVEEPAALVEPEPIAPDLPVEEPPTELPPVVEASEETQTEGRWRAIALAAGGIVVAIIAIAAVLQFAFPAAEASPTPVPFVETPIDGSAWSVSRAMPQAKSGMAAATVGLSIYEIGGEAADGVTGAMNVYDTATNQWQAAAEKPTAVADASAAALFGEIYVPGGRLADGTLTAVVEAYSPVNNAWRPVADLPQPLAGGLTLSDGSYLYLFGGWDGERELDTAYVYDAGADSWEALPPMPFPRSFAMGGEAAGNLYAVGGYEGDGETAVCQFFNVLEQSWNLCADMLQPRAGGGGSTVLNKLYVIGGGDGSAEGAILAELYDPVDDSWQSIDAPPTLREANWRHAGVARIETKIYTFGGQRDDGALLDDAFVYAPIIYRTFIPSASAGEDPE